MLNNNYIILDIETTINKKAIEKSVAKQLGFETADEFLKFKNATMENGKTYFPKPVFHKIHTIGMLYVSQSTSLKYIDFSYEDELVTLSEFWKIIGKCQLPTIVGFNSKSFDIPVISMRTGKNMIELKDVYPEIKRFHDCSDQWEKYGPNYFNRNSKYHIDLIDDHGWPKPSLSEICSLYDIPVKNYGHGSEVEAMNREDVRRYCKEDVIATTKLWLYHMLKFDQEFDINDFMTLNDRIKSLEEVENE